MASAWPLLSNRAAIPSRVEQSASYRGRGASGEARVAIASGDIARPVFVEMRWVVVLARTRPAAVIRATLLGHPRDELVRELTMRIRWPSPGGLHEAVGIVPRRDGGGMALLLVGRRLN